MICCQPVKLLALAVLGLMAMGVLRVSAWFAPGAPAAWIPPGNSLTATPATFGDELLGDGQLAALGISDNPGAILSYLRELVSPRNQKLLDNALTDLGAEDFATRENAQTVLANGGLAALALLEKAQSSEDPEVARRAKSSAEAVRRSRSPALIGAMVRSLESRRINGATEVLLSLGEQARESEPRLWHSLRAQVARLESAGLGVSALSSALADAAAPRRALAASALGGNADWSDRIVDLLNDADDQVRVEAAWSLVRAGRREGMASLVSLMAIAPAGLREDALEHLHQLGGDDTPDMAWAPDAAERLAFTSGWENWWKQASQRLGDVHIPPRPFLDRTLIVFLDAGEIAMLGSDDKDLWRFDKVDFPLDAEPLPGNRVLLAENQGNRVTIRSRTGKVLWEYPVTSPIAAQALPGGRIFIATRTDLFVVDRQGNRIRDWNRPAGEVYMRATALPDGGLGVVTLRQKFMRLNAAGEVLDTFPVLVSTTGGRIDVSPDGRVLVPMMHQDMVVELDMGGHDLRRFRVNEPIMAHRLPNGHVMMTSMAEQRAMEYDAAGRLVWDYQSQFSRVTRALRH